MTRTACGRRRCRQRWRVPTIRRLPILVAVVLVLAGLLAARPVPTRAAGPLPALPPSWPSDRVELGLADSPGGAAALRAPAPFKFRYQYLAGGVNTGNGWSTWNPNGQFVSWYIADSADHGPVPVFPYYMLLQSNPATGGTEQAEDISNLANPATMAACYADLRLFFQRAGRLAARDPPCRARPVGLHRAGDRHGRRRHDGPGVRRELRRRRPGRPAEQRRRVRPGDRPAARPATPPTCCSRTTSSVWGTNSTSRTRTARTRRSTRWRPAPAPSTARSARAFDLTFTDSPTATPSFKQIVYGDGGASRWDDADFVRYARFIEGYVADDGPPRRRVADPARQHEDARDERHVGPLPGQPGAVAARRPGAGRISRPARDAGVVALLFGGGADGTTCACDAQRRRRHQPGRRSTATPALSLSADDDGGFFRERAAAYYAAGGLDLGFGVPPPPPVTPPRRPRRRRP